MKRNELITLALSQVGIKEIRGEKHNPEIVKYFKKMDVNPTLMKDETAWCSAFINWLALTLDLPNSGRLNARSWLNVGCRVGAPQIGDLVILWRESKNSWKGHVGIFISETEDGVWALGGNQRNKVGVNVYKKNRVLEFRNICD